MTRSAIQHLDDADTRLRQWIRRIGPIRLPPRRSRDPYAALLQSVVYQQLHGAAAKAIWNRVLDLFEDRDPQPERLIAMTETRLRGAGLSRNKSLSLRAIAAGRLSGEIPDERGMAQLDDREIYDRLTQLRGVGPWTVEMLMIFTLRRPDVMPATDFGIRKGFQITYRKLTMPKPKEILQKSECWRPYRTMASLYLWRIADASKSKKAIS